MLFIRDLNTDVSGNESNVKAIIVINFRDLQ